MLVMAKKGYDGASIADIAKAAKLTAGLVHYHFKSKLEILTALAEQLSQDSASALHQHLDASSDSPSQAIDAVIDFYLGVGATAKPEVLACWIALSGEALRHKAIGKVFEATLADTHQVVKARIEAGIRKKTLANNIDAGAAAAALVAAIQGYFVIAGTARALVPKGSAAQTVKQMMQGVLGAKR